MTTAKPSVSLIIACYNQAPFLENIFLSLKNQSFTDFEIVIADDGSKQALADVIQKYATQFRHPVQHAWHADTGFRKTIIVNQAVRQSKADYLVFIDGDCILHHRFIERHYRRRKHGIVLSGRRIMLDQEITTQLTPECILSKQFEKQSFWQNHCPANELKRGKYRPYIFKILNAISKDYWAFGSNFSLHKQDFIAINGYDESILGRGLEDINLSQRFKLKGYRTQRLTYEALQYHQFHHSDPVPHSHTDAERIIHPQHFYPAKGINNGQ